MKYIYIISNLIGWVLFFISGMLLYVSGIFMDTENKAEAVKYLIEGVDSGKRKAGIK